VSVRIVRVVRFVFAVAALLPVAAMTMGEGPPPATPAPEVVSRGAALYRIHCASCHGAKGTGDGPVAEALVKKPTDLTALARRPGGEFPRERVRSAIDGRTLVSAHGAREMPVWGLSFAESGRDAARPGEVESEIEALVRYLATIQRR
jgi:mono/diheme cytochrome c family protein